MLKKRALPKAYYLQSDVVALSRDVLGKMLFSRSLSGQVTAGMIIETEAYAAPEDKASHAYAFRRTQRNEVMFWSGGVAYVYLCYGIHHLFNVVTNEEEKPHAILIRALYPTVGMEIMQKRRGATCPKNKLTNGPGSLAKAMGMTVEDNGVDLTDRDSRIWLEEGINVPPDSIVASPRIGIDYAQEYVDCPWRFCISSPCLQHLAF